MISEKRKDVWRAPKKSDNTKYYEILGVSNNPTLKDLKKAYRNSSINNHPDKGGDPEKFKELAQAYEVLSDPEKHEFYDQYGEDALKEGMGGGGGMHNPFDIFKSFFGGNPFGGGGSSRGRNGAKFVDSALATGKIYDGEGFKYIKESFETGTLHLIGLLSDGGVHSRLDQVQLLLKGDAEHGAKRICVHFLTDGRDVLDGSSVGFVETLQSSLVELRAQGVDARVASGGGRIYVTMDRYENDWEIVKRGWDAQVLGEAPYKFTEPVEAVKTLRQEPGVNDQYLKQFVCVDESGKPVGPILDGDVVVTFNFCADRMTMLAKALEYEKFDNFDRVRFPKIRYAVNLSSLAMLHSSGMVTVQGISILNWKSMWRSQ